MLINQVLSPNSPLNSNLTMVEINNLTQVIHLPKVHKATNQVKYQGVQAIIGVPLLVSRVTNNHHYNLNTPHRLDISPNLVLINPLVVGQPNPANLSIDLQLANSHQANTPPAITHPLADYHE